MKHRPTGVRGSQLNWCFKERCHAGRGTRSLQGAGKKIHTKNMTTEKKQDVKSGKAGGRRGTEQVNEKKKWGGGRARTLKKGTGGRSAGEMDWWRATHWGNGDPDHRGRLAQKKGCKKTRKPSELAPVFGLGEKAAESKRYRENQVNRRPECWGNFRGVKASI